MDAEEVDPIAEADVYMAYGRDAQAEEILKEALQKDANRTAVHVKLLEIYANRKDTKAFEQNARQAEEPDQRRRPRVGQGRGARPLDRSAERPVRRRRRRRGGGRGGRGAAPRRRSTSTSAARASRAPAPDISLDAPSQAPADATGSSTSTWAAATRRRPPTPPTDFTPEGTLIMGAQQPESSVSGLDFDLGTPQDRSAGGTAGAPLPTPGWTSTSSSTTAAAARAEPSAPARRPVLDQPRPAARLASPRRPRAAADPKWQEVATKLDLAKAYEEMGDKDGARELLNEVMKDGDAAQKGQAQQLLAKLG